MIHDGRRNGIRRADHALTIDGHAGNGGVRIGRCDPDTPQRGNLGVAVQSIILAQRRSRPTPPWLQNAPSKAARRQEPDRRPGGDLARRYLIIVGSAVRDTIDGGIRADLRRDYATSFWRHGDALEITTRQWGPRHQYRRPKQVSPASLRRKRSCCCAATSHPAWPGKISASPNNIGLVLFVWIGNGERCCAKVRSSTVPQWGLNDSDFACRVAAGWPKSPKAAAGP